MSKENLPVKKGKKSTLLKRGLSAFLAFIGISNAAYAQAKIIDDYNTNPGYNEKATENIDAKYDKAFEKMGIVVDDISDKEIEDKISDKDISDKEIEDKSNPMFSELRASVNNNYLSEYIEDKDIEDKSISDKDIEDKGI